MKTIFFLLISIPLLFNCSNKEKLAKEENTSAANVQTESINDFKLEADAVILDIRTPVEIAMGTLPNAKFLDYLKDDYKQKIMALDKDKKYYVFCASGGRSGQMTKEMIAAGFTKVVDLSNGYSQYKLPEVEITIDN